LPKIHAQIEYYYFHNIQAQNRSKSVQKGRFLIDFFSFLIKKDKKQIEMIICIVKTKKKILRKKISMQKLEECRN